MTYAAQTFVDGQVLTASQLNTMGNNIAVLEAVVNAPAIPFPHWYTATNVDDTHTYWLRHRQRYLWLNYQVLTDNLVAGTITLDTETPINLNLTVGAYEHIIDLQTVYGALAVGSFYTITINVELEPLTGKFRMRAIRERNAAS
jgi:hypothetical protein